MRRGIDRLARPDAGGSPPVFVLVRVFDRIPDLEVCLDLIRETWTRGRYEVVVVSNGRAAGYPVDAAQATPFQLVSLADNAGHILGNAQLLTEGMKRLPPECEYVVLLEADTWLFGDALIQTVIRRMKQKGWAWSSAAWLDRYHSLAVDFAVVRADLLRRHPEVLAFERHAECHVANHLRRLRLPYGLVPELMPVHVPRFVRRLLPKTGGRFRAFPDGPLVSHHVEELKGGMHEKKWWANVALGEERFPGLPPTDWLAEQRALRRRLRLARWAPRAGWFRGKAEKDLSSLD